MTIAFRYFPYLVQLQVMDQMNLIDIFSIYSISKKSQTLARSYFNRHEFELYYGVTKERFWIYKNSLEKRFLEDRDKVYILPRIGFKLSTKCSRMGEALDPLTIPFSNPEDTSGNKEKIMKFTRGLFPKLHLYVSFYTEGLTDFLDTMNFVKSSNIPIKRVNASVHLDAKTDELVRAVMTQCSDVKNLQIYCSFYEPFQYDFRPHAPLKFDFFELICSRLVTKDYLMPIFLSCKKVIIKAVDGVHYTDQELTEICKQWLEAKETQYLEIQKVQTATEGIWKLPGSVHVQKFTVGDHMYPYEQWRFQGKCRMMKKADGTPAIVYHDKFDYICFLTDFKDAVIGGGI